MIVPIYQQEGTIQLPPGTVDILPDSVFYRTMTRVGDSYATYDGGTAANADDGELSTSLTQTIINGRIAVQFLTPTVVAHVGIIANGDQWHNLVFEASDDGVTYTTLQTVSPPYGEQQTFYEDKVWHWYEITSPVSGGSLFFQVRETGGGTLDIRELYLASSATDIPLARLNRMQYLTLPNKDFAGRPVQFWLSRDLNPDDDFAEQPKMYLWPVPGSESIFSTIMLMRHRYIADLSDFNASLEMPVRWYNALIWWLADLSAAELPEVPPDREAYLATRAMQALAEAMDEERDNSPVLIQADISAYTR
jgi:hypothetical protein